MESKDSVTGSRLETVKDNEGNTLQVRRSPKFDKYALTESNEPYCLTTHKVLAVHDAASGTLHHHNSAPAHAVFAARDDLGRPCTIHYADFARDCKAGHMA